jgi:hypothetical protein
MGYKHWSNTLLCHASLQIQVLAYFDQNLELWSGRLAMIGFVSLPIAEFFTGDALF